MPVASSIQTEEAHPINQPTNPLAWVVSEERDTLIETHSLLKYGRDLKAGPGAGEGAL